MPNLQSVFCPHCQYSLEGAPAQEQCFPLAASLQRVATAGCLHLEFGWPNGVLDLQRSSVSIRLSGPVGSVLLSSHTDASCYIFMWETCARLHFLAGPPGLASASAPIQWHFAEERSMGKSVPEEHIQQSSDFRLPQPHLMGECMASLCLLAQHMRKTCRRRQGWGVAPPCAWLAAQHQRFELLLDFPACALSIPGAGRM